MEVNDLYQRKNTVAQRTLQLTRVGRNLIQKGPNSWEKGEKNLWNQDIKTQICIKRFWGN